MSENSLDKQPKMCYDNINRKINKGEIKMTNFWYAFYHYYYFGSLGTTLEKMSRAVNSGELKDTVAAHILRCGLNNDIHYGYNAGEVNEIVSNFKKELASV